MTFLTTFSQSRTLPSRPAKVTNQPTPDVLWQWPFITTVDAKRSSSTDHTVHHVPFMWVWSGVASKCCQQQEHSRRHTEASGNQHRARVICNCPGEREDHFLGNALQKEKVHTKIIPVITILTGWVSITFRNAFNWRTCYNFTVVKILILINERYSALMYLTECS